MTLALHHLALEVTDLGAAERFYVEVLGLPLLRRWEDEAGRPRSLWVGLSEQGAFLALELVAPERASAPRGAHCLALGIRPEERASHRRRLEAAGHPIERETAYTIYARDPDGHTLALSHYPDAPLLG